jgi:hypothetical protein
MWAFLFGQVEWPSKVHWRFEDSDECGDHESETGVRISIFFHFGRD